LITAFVGDFDPTLANEGKEHVARTDCGLDHLHEVHARLDVVDVDEDVLGRKCSIRSS
jgi:hypothetical protein